MLAELEKENERLRMATITKRKTKTKNGFSLQIRFELDGSRKTVSLGRVQSLKYAEKFRQRIEELVNARKYGLAHNAELLAWLARLPKALAAKLAKLGLIEKKDKANATLADLVKEYLDFRNDAKPTVTKTLKNTGKRLVEFFGPAKPIQDITEGDARNFEKHLRTSAKRWKNGTGKLSPATVGRMCAEAKLFFKFAITKRYIFENPFHWASKGQYVDWSRNFYVDKATITKVIDACPNAEWRLIVALARFAGLRKDSEIATLTWDRVNWQENTIRVYSPKTERYAGKGERTIPIFADLRPYLEDVWNLVKPGVDVPLSSPIIASYHGRGIPWTVLKKIVQKAGLTPWPKLFHNLRGSMATDIAKAFGPNVESHWIGHTEKVARTNYLLPTPADIAAAVGEIPRAENVARIGSNWDAPNSGNVQKDAKKRTTTNPILVNIGRAGFEPATKGL